MRTSRTWLMLARPSSSSGVPGMVRVWTWAFSQMPTTSRICLPEAVGMAMITCRMPSSSSQRGNGMPAAQHGYAVDHGVVLACVVVEKADDLKAQLRVVAGFRCARARAGSPAPMISTGCAVPACGHGCAWPAAIQHAHQQARARRHGQAQQQQDERNRARNPHRLARQTYPRAMTASDATNVEMVNAPMSNVNSSTDA